MKKTTLLSTFAAAIALLTCSPAFGLELDSPAQVRPGDTFSFDIAGFNSTSGVGYLLTPDETTAFGGTQTFTGAGFNGQDITVTSSETVGATTTTDTITVSTPTNFLTTTTVNGTTITALQLDIGDANAGGNTLDLVLPIATSSSTGSALYSGGSITLTPTTTLSNGNLSVAAAEGVNAGTTAITGFTVHSFTYTITYSAVPEPSTWALMGLGGIGCVGLALRRRLA